MKRQRQYDMTNPYGIDGREVRVNADLEVLNTLLTLDCVRHAFISEAASYAVVDLSPLYDVDDAWLLVMAALDEYTTLAEHEPDPDVWNF